MEVYFILFRIRERRGRAESRKWGMEGIPEESVWER
jgi:hypothetical protein